MESENFKDCIKFAIVDVICYRSEFWIMIIAAIQHNMSTNGIRIIYTFSEAESLTIKGLIMCCKWPGMPQTRGGCGGYGEVCQPVCLSAIRNIQKNVECLAVDHG